MKLSEESRLSDPFITFLEGGSIWGSLDLLFPTHKKEIRQIAVFGLASYGFLGGLIDCSDAGISG